MSTAMLPHAPAEDSLVSHDQPSNQGDRVDTTSSTAFHFRTTKGGAADWLLGVMGSNSVHVQKTVNQELKSLCSIKTHSFKPKDPKNRSLLVLAVKEGL